MSIDAVNKNVPVTSFLLANENLQESFNYIADQVANATEPFSIRSEVSDNGPNQVCTVVFPNGKCCKIALLKAIHQYQLMSSVPSSPEKRLQQLETLQKLQMLFDKSFRSSFTFTKKEFDAHFGGCKPFAIEHCAPGNSSNYVVSVEMLRKAALKQDGCSQPEEETTTTTQVREEKQLEPQSTNVVEEEVSSTSQEKQVEKDTSSQEEAEISTPQRLIMNEDEDGGADVEKAEEKKPQAPALQEEDSNNVCDTEEKAEEKTSASQEEATADKVFALREQYKVLFGENPVDISDEDLVAVVPALISSELFQSQNRSTT